MSWRVAGIAVATLVSGAVAPLLVDRYGGGLAGHRAMGLAVGVLIAGGALLSYLGTRTAMRASPPTERRLRAQLAVAAGNRGFRRLLACFVVQSAGVATVLAGVSYFADQAPRDPETGPTLLFACFVGPALLVMPLWTRVGARAGKLVALVAASLIFAAGALALVAAPVLPAVGVYPLVALIGRRRSRTVTPSGSVPGRHRPARRS